MVGLNRCRFSKTGFNDIRINRSLYKIIDSTDFLCFFFKYTDKFFSDNLSFCFRFCNSCKFAVETFLCIDSDKIQVIWTIRSEYSFYFITVIFTSQTVVYEYAGQLLADCYCKHNGCNR